jgi:hypothetical protein
MIGQLEEIVACAPIGLDDVHRVQGAVGEVRVGVKIPAPETARRREGANPHGSEVVGFGAFGQENLTESRWQSDKLQLQNMFNQICYLEHALERWAIPLNRHGLCISLISRAFSRKIGSTLAARSNTRRRIASYEEKQIIVNQ